MDTKLLQNKHENEGLFGFHVKRFDLLLKSQLKPTKI